MILNDSHYLLDEVLTKLPEIKDIEQAMENRESWAAQDEVGPLLFIIIEGLTFN
jgi:hypothetical protein